MFLLVSFFVALVTAGAKELAPNELRAFEGIFFRSIAQHVAAEYNVLLPALDKHLASVTECKQKILKTEISCKTCFIKECKAEFKGGNLNHDVDISSTQGPLLEPDTRGLAGLIVLGLKMKKLFDIASLVSAMVDVTPFSGGVVDDLNSVAGGVAGGIDNVGIVLGELFKDFSNFVGGLFGRRRRSLIQENAGGDMNHYKIKIPPELRKCMLGCSDCVPFFQEQKSLTAEICGEEFERENVMVKQVFDTIRDLIYANGDPREERPKILINVEYDEKSCSCETSLCDELYVTAMTPNGEERYKSAYKYNINVPKLTAEELALELFQKWQTMPRGLFETPESVTLLPTD